MYEWNFSFAHHTIYGKWLYQRCRALLSIRGGYFALLPQFFPVFDIGGMNLDHDFFQLSKVSEDQKKGLHQNRKSFFPEFKCCRPTSSDSDEDQSQIIGGDADVDHSQIIGGMQSNYWKDISSPGFGTPGLYSLQPILILSMWTSSRKAGNNNFYSSIHSTID